MIHSAFFIAIYFLITTFSCTAGEQPHIQKANILAEVTCVKEPRYGVWLAGEEVVVSGSSGASICNYQTNTETTKIWQLPNNNTPWLIDHPNKKTIAFSDLEDDVVIYDTETKNTSTKKSTYNNPCVLNPQVPNSNMMDRYKSDKGLHFIQLPEDVRLRGFHPTQPLCLITSDRTFWQSNIETCSCDGSILEGKKKFERNDVTHDCCYSGDGSFIAIRNAGMINAHNSQQSISALDLITNTEKYLPSGSDRLSIDNMIFHPTSFILAGLAVSPSFKVYYWDTKKHQLITVTEICENPEGYSYCGRRIDFSNDGTKLIIVTENRCFIVEVPFEAICKNKDQAIFNCWALQQYQQNQRNDIPDELLRVLQQTVFECSKYSFTNY